MTDGRLFCDDPAEFFANSLTQLHSVPRDQLQDMQLAALRRRFAELRHNIPVLEEVADAQGITSIDRVEDAVPLPFDHSVYKSYPANLLEQANFNAMNRWLGNLTVHELEAIDVSDCAGIDDWIDAMLERSPLAICATPGGDGTMSFMPHSKAELERQVRTYGMVYLQHFGESAAPAEEHELHIVWPGFRHPGDGYRHEMDLMVKHLLDGDEARMHAAYPGRMSLDVLLLSVRMGAAQARGEEIHIPPELLQRKEEFDRLQQGMPGQLEALVNKCVETLRGKRLFIQGPWGLLHNLAAKGLARGLENIFSSDSIVIEGGSTEGAPENWRADVCRFFGVPETKGLYAMHEMLARNMRCAQGRYHLAPWVIPFLLDPETGNPLPRNGSVTGRFAFHDLLVDTHWGGFITGDEVSTDWSTPCPCGQSSFFLENSIRRYSASDKIQGSLRDNAFKRAMDQLRQQAS